MEPVHQTPYIKSIKGRPKGGPFVLFDLAFALTTGSPPSAMLPSGRVSCGQRILTVLGERIAAGLVSIKDGYTALATRTELREAGAHPVPDARGREAAQRLVGALQHSR
jgi:hypothetical protein